MFLLTLFLLIIFWPIWIFSHNVASDFPYVYKDLLLESFNLPFAWITRTANGFGENSLFVLWSWPIDFLYGVLAKLGFGFDFLQIILAFIPFILLGSYSIWKLLSSYKLSYKAKFAGSLIYLTNTYILLLIDGGQLSIALSYSLLPLIYLSVIKSLDSNSFYKKLKTAILVSMYGFLDVRFLYIAFVLISLRFIYQIIITKKINTISWIVSTIVTLSTFIVFHFYWIWPAINVGLTIPETVVSTSNVSFLSFAKLKHAVMLLQPHWYLNDFGNIAATRREFIILPVIAFISILIHKNKKEVFYWVLISILGVLLAKGSNPPFVSFYPWVFENIPGFVLLRDPTKFYFLIALGFSVLTAFSFDKLVKKLPFIFGFYLISLLFLIRPVYLGQMTGLFSKSENINSFNIINDEISIDNKFGRVLWIPNRHPLGYASTTHPVVEVSRIQSLRPFAVGSVGTYETSNFLREGTHIPQLLEASAIKYIAYPFPENKKHNLKQEDMQYYATFSGQLKEKAWTEEVYSDENVNLFKVKGDQELFFAAENIFRISENDEVYKQFSYNSEFKLKNNAIITDNKYNSEFYYPSEQLNNYPDDHNWWSREADDFAWVRNFLEQKYNITNQNFTYSGGYAINENSGTLTIQSNKLPKSKEIYIRVFKSPKSGELKILQNSKLVSTINTKIEKPEFVKRKLTGYKNVSDQIFEYEKSYFEWVKIENVNLDKDLEISAEGNINIVNAVSSELPKTKEVNLIKGESNISVNYKKISPVEYEITVKGVDEKAMLVFAQNFDDKWLLNNKQAIEVYGLINGFEISEDGIYTLYYSPQKYVNQGLLITFVGFIIINLYIIRYEFRNNKKASKD